MPTFPRCDYKTIASNRVFLKNTWAGSWVENSKLHCRQVAFALSPNVSSATFHYRHGHVAWPGTSSFIDEPQIAVNPRSYVKVEIDGADNRTGYTWYGVWRTARWVGGNRQILVADGMEALLRTTCKRMPWVDSTHTVRWAGRGLSFNLDLREGNRSRTRGNRSRNKYQVNGEEVYVFASDLENAEEWSTKDAVETLLAVAAPLNDSDEVILNWTLSEGDRLPEYDAPVLPTDGRTFLSLLNSLVCRYRLMALRFSGTTVTPHTFTSSDIAIHDTRTTVGSIPANPDQVTIDFAKDQTSHATLGTEASHVADVVTVVGDRRQSVFSIEEENDDTCVGKWSATEEAKYVAGASGAADYPAASEPRLRAERDQEARDSDELRAVFTHFGPPDDWDQLAGNGGGGQKKPIAENADGSQAWVYPPDLVFLPRLPLRTGHTYKDDTIGNMAAAHIPGHRGAVLNLATPPYENLPILAFRKIVDAATAPDGTDRWQQMDRTGEAARHETDEGYRDWSVDVRPAAGETAVEVRVHGEPQHVLAEDEFTGRDDRIRGDVRWQEMILTVACEESRRAQVNYPTNPSAVGEFVQELRIDAPGNKVIYVLPGTVVAVDPDTLALVRSGGGYLQDDRDFLQVIAERAYQWHRIPRYSLTLSSVWVDGDLEVGQYVTSITDHDGIAAVNSVITEITIDFPVAESEKVQPPRATYVTAFAEMDAMKL